MIGWPVLIVLMGFMLAVTIYLFGSMFRSIQDERRKENLKRIWPNFGLSIAFSILFLLSWIGHGVAQWNKFSAEQEAHNQPAEVKEFIAEFSASTLENWQSEFLQLFSFVVMAALLVHHGSAESKDSEERIERIVQRIEKKLDEQNGSKSSRRKTPAKK
jgi:Na+/H+ antiporter NhaC